MEVTVIRSNRKTVAIQVNSDLSVTVRAPRLASKKDIDRIIEEKETWICKHIEEIKKKKERYRNSDRALSCESDEPNHLPPSQRRAKSRRYPYQSKPKP